MKIAKDLRGLSPEELAARKEEFQKELLKLNVQVASGANPKEAGKIKQLKKSLAIIETISNESPMNQTPMNQPKNHLKPREVSAK